jgi:hypothetical protein
VIGITMVGVGGLLRREERLVVTAPIRLEIEAGQLDGILHAS